MTRKKFDLGRPVSVPHPSKGCAGSKAKDAPAQNQKSNPDLDGDTDLDGHRLYDRKGAEAASSPQFASMRPSSETASNRSTHEKQNLLPDHQVSCELAMLDCAGTANVTGHVVAEMPERWEQIN